MKVKHKKILKNFNFKTMVEKANVPGGELNKRIERFNKWCEITNCPHLLWEFLKFNKNKYCFEFDSVYEDDDIYEYYKSGSTECSKKYIGDYIYKINKVSSFLRNRWIK